jgi:hypothetical protein
MLSKFSPGANLEPGFAGRAQGASGVHAPRHMLAILLLLGLPVAAQSPGTSAQDAQDGGIIRRGLDNSGAAGIDARMEARRIAALNLQRQHQMVSDADKLLKLARELNADSDAGGTILSQAERMQKAAEIEKLAKNVKDKMTFAIGPPQELLGPFAAWQR